MCIPISVGAIFGRLDVETLEPNLVAPSYVHVESHAVLKINGLDLCVAHFGHVYTLFCASGKGHFRHFKKEKRMN